MQIPVASPHSRTATLTGPTSRAAHILHDPLHNMGHLRSMFHTTKLWLRVHDRTCIVVYQPLLSGHKNRSRASVHPARVSLHQCIRLPLYAVWLQVAARCASTACCTLQHAAPMHRIKLSRES